MLVNATEAAKHFGFNRVYFLRLASRKQIPGVKYGDRRWMFDISEIEQYFKSKTMENILK